MLALAAAILLPPEPEAPTAQALANAVGVLRAVACMLRTVQRTTARHTRLGVPPRIASLAMLGSRYRTRPMRLGYVLMRVGIPVSSPVSGSVNELSGLVKQPRSLLLADLLLLEV